MNLKQYAYWQTEDDIGYWMIFDELTTAVEEADGKEIFEFTGKSLGFLKVKKTVKVVKDRKKK